MDTEEQNYRQPEHDLTGPGQLLVNRFYFRHFYFEHVGPNGARDQIFFLDRKKSIKLKACGQVELVKGKQIVIHMLNNDTITLEPDDFNLWHVQLPLWISFIRQIPYWSVALDFHCNQPMSWGKKRVVGQAWEQLFFVWNNEEMQWEYQKTDRKGADALGIKKIGGSLAVLREGKLLTVENWTVKFETSALAQKWQHFFFRVKEELAHLKEEEEEEMVVPAIERLLETRPMPLYSKMDGKEWIDSARRQFISLKGKDKYEKEEASDISLDDAKDDDYYYYWESVKQTSSEDI